MRLPFIIILAILDKKQVLMPDKTTLKEIAKLFLKLGVIGFGGPAAHIAMMRRQVVVKKVAVRTTFFRPNRGNKLLYEA